MSIERASGLIDASHISFRHAVQLQDNSLITVESLSKKFGDFLALDDVNLEIGRGEVFGLLGPNGAGKSTLLRCMLGFLKPTTGRAMINGLDCHRERVTVHQGLSYLPGDARLYRTMKARRALKLFCSLRGRPENSERSDSAISDKDAVGLAYERGLELARRLELDLDRWIGLMSTGMRQKVALVICLSADTPLLILDEPTANLDPTVRGQILELVLEAKSAGRTVILSSHVLSEIEEVCDRVGILKSGKLVHQESMSQLAKQHRIRARFNGELPVAPESIAERLMISQHGDRVQIETPGELSPILKWLSELSLREVTIEPVGLRSVYDRYHSAAMLPVEASASSGGNETQ